MAEATNDEPRVDPTVEPAEASLTDGQVIARKSADVHKRSSTRHVKVFVLPPGPKPTEENGYSHEANMAATRQYMLSQGMRPTGKVRLDSIEQHRNGVSWVLTYSVAAKPTGRVDGPSEPDVVTGGDDVAVNTTGTGHSNDTTDKVPNA